MQQKSLARPPKGHRRCVESVFKESSEAKCSKKALQGLPKVTGNALNYFFCNPRRPEAAKQALQGLPKVIGNALNLFLSRLHCMHFLRLEFQGQR
jgi:hypothetical protein